MPLIPGGKAMRKMLESTYKNISEITEMGLDSKKIDLLRHTGS